MLMICIIRRWWRHSVPILTSGWCQNLKMGAGRSLSAPSFPSSSMPAAAPWCVRIVGTSFYQHARTASRTVWASVTACPACVNARPAFFNEKDIISMASDKLCQDELKACERIPNIDHGSVLDQELWVNSHKLCSQRFQAFVKLKVKSRQNKYPLCCNWTYVMAADAKQGRALLPPAASSSNHQAPCYWGRCLSCPQFQLQEEGQASSPEQSQLSVH